MPLSLVLDFVALSLFAYLVRTYVSDSDRARCRTYTRWGKQYGMQLVTPSIKEHDELSLGADAGDVTSISVIGRLVVFVNSARAAKDLFEHTGTRYMDRPEIPIIDMYAGLLSCCCGDFADAQQDGGTF